MSRSSSPSLWLPVNLAGCHIDSLNLKHPWVVDQVGDDITAGTDVYYDRRWPATERFCRFLLANPTWVTGKIVLVLGAGVGLETVIIGRLCRFLYLNDLASRALDLCAQQLRRNGITTFTCLAGSYEELPLPPVDLLVGCFVVYNQETARAMLQLLAKCPLPVLLMNDPMPDFQLLVRQTSRSVRSLLPPGEPPCVVFA